MHICIGLATQDSQEMSEARKKIFAEYRFQSTPISAYPDRETWGRTKQAKEGQDALMRLAGGPATTPARRRPQKTTPTLPESK